MLQAYQGLYLCPKTLAGIFILDSAVKQMYGDRCSLITKLRKVDFARSTLF
ncbi:hypothetical protein KSC_016260 [Ktedonobacter sp. SOSP1-52]|nr:hypothetical protein KSC_016260 [Ktedonobacter sp. SOSP1-52]